MHSPEFGVRRQAQRDAALDFHPEMLLTPSKAPSKPAHKIKRFDPAIWSAATCCRFSPRAEFSRSLERPTSQSTANLCVCRLTITDVPSTYPISQFFKTTEHRGFQS